LHKKGMVAYFTRDVMNIKRETVKWKRTKGKKKKERKTQLSCSSGEGKQNRGLSAGDIRQGGKNLLLRARKASKRGPSLSREHIGGGKGRPSWETT